MRLFVSNSVALTLICISFCGCDHSPKLSSSQPLNVLVLPLGSVTDADVEVATAALRTTFPSLKVTKGEAAPLPSAAYYPPRKRYKANGILKYANALPPKWGRVVCITAKDISTSLHDKEDWGVLGLGLQPGRACVVSTFRLGQSKVGEELFHERLAKVVIHEFGHTSGLPHCPNAHCLMQDAQGRIATVDAENGFCDSCREKLRKAQLLK